MIINSRQFYKGLAMIITFTIIFALMISPVINGKTVIQTADQLFNSLTKGSTYYMPKLAKDAARFQGTVFDVSVSAKSKEEAAKISKVFSMAGADVQAEDARVNISGDLGKLAQAALTDADALFNNQKDTVTNKYGIDGKEVVNCWWTVFNALESKYKLEAKSTEMSFVASLKGKGLEVAYNFDGIQADSVKERSGITTFMLLFYIIYTVWYGFAIMYLMEGLGIVASNGEKAEA